LVERFLAGDRGAFEQIVLRHQDRVVRLCFRLLDSHQRAEEAAQEVFVKVFGNLDRFRGDSQFSTWLYRVTINHCRNIHAHRSRRRERDHISLDRGSVREDGTHRVTELSDSAPTAEDELLAEERLRQLREELEMLDPLWREILILRDVEGFSYEETAAALSLAAGTVKSRIHRARTELRRRMLKRTELGQVRG
jgi:RNA polymerase sigma-70 factor (ECF subfamily)